MKDSEKLKEWIDRYQSGELDGEELSRFRTILENDPLLRRELQIDRDLEILLSRGDLIEISEKIGQARDKRGGPLLRNMPFMIAAALLLLVTIGLSVILWKDHIRNGKDIQAGAGPADRQTGLYAAVNFVPLHEFEVLVGTVTRGPSCKLLQPACRISEKRGNRIPFEWTDPDSRAMVTIELFDNRGYIVCSSGMIPGTHYELITRALVPGLYYWKMIIDEELVTMGRLLLW
ncbi:MAG: hypothetical protein WCO93_11895 [bacterium]